MKTYKCINDSTRKILIVAIAISFVITSAPILNNDCTYRQGKTISNDSSCSGISSLSLYNSIETTKDEGVSESSETTSSWRSGIGNYSDSEYSYDQTLADSVTKMDLTLNVQITNEVLAGMIYVDGYIYYWYQCNDYPHTTPHDYFPVKHAKVDVFDWEDPVRGYEYVCTVETNDYGYYCTGPIVNDDGWFEGTRDIVCRVYPESHTSSIGKVYGNLGSYYYFESPIHFDVPDGQVRIETGYLYADDPLTPAWQIYDFMVDCDDAVSNIINVAGDTTYSMDNIAVVWTPGHNADYGWGCPTTSHYHHQGFPAGQIHINSEDWRSAQILYHEYGHHVYYHMYDHYTSSPGGTHDWFSQLDPALAWSEGWADFFTFGSGEKLF